MILNQGWRVSSADENFSKRRNVLTIVADKKKITLRLDHGIKEGSVVGVREVFFYRRSKANLAAIARAKTVRLSIDGLSGTVEADTLGLFDVLVSST